MEIIKTALDIVLFIVVTMVVAAMGRFLVICSLCELKIDIIPKKIWMMLLILIGLSEFYPFESAYSDTGTGVLDTNGALRFLGIEKWEWARYKKYKKVRQKTIYTIHIY